MKMNLMLLSELKQELKLSQVIEFVNLMNVPDEILNVVTGAVLYNPESIEIALQNRKKKENYMGGADKVQTIYSSLTPSKGDLNIEKGGLIGFPDLRTLEGLIGNYQTNVTPDVTYIGRENKKPEIVFSDHLKGLMALRLIPIDSSKYPETSKLISQIKRFDEWKREKLINVYVIFGEKQRDFLENFDKTKFQVFKPENLGNQLNIHSSTIYRLLSNRWVEARNIAGNQKFIYAKDLLVTENDLKKYHVLPKLNKILSEEFENKKAYSDSEISNKVGGLARRTFTKYRKSSNIPLAGERERIYFEESKKEPYRIE